MTEPDRPAKARPAKIAEPAKARPAKSAEANARESAEANAPKGAEAGARKAASSAGSKSKSGDTMATRTKAPHPAKAELDHLVGGDHTQPHSILGAHPLGPGQTAVRTLRPEADSVSVVLGGQHYPLERLHPNGVFGGVLDTEPADYRLEVSYGE